MTNDDFLFWGRAFLAAMQGVIVQHSAVGGIGYAECAGDARGFADAALAVWREKRAEMVTTNSPCSFCHAPGDCLCEERKGA